MLAVWYGAWTCGDSGVLVCMEGTSREKQSSDRVKRLVKITDY